MDDHEHDIVFREPRHHVRLWLALLTGPVAWMIGLVAKYAVVPFACGSTNTWSLHAISIATLIITLIAGFVGWQVWQRAGREWPSESATPMARTRFMAVMALMSSALFALAIVAQWLSSAYLNPCMSI
jgi:hypothetical protein